MQAGLGLLIVASLGVSASAQIVPVPKPAPKARVAIPPSVSDAQAKAPLTTAATTIVPDPIIPDPRRNVPTNIFASFDANQKAQAAKVSSYLSSLNTLVGNFVQVGPDGTKTKGDFYIKLATQDIYPLSQTPLRYLLSDRIDLMKDTNVVNVSADDQYITVTIEEKSAIIGTSRLMLMLGAKDNQLKQWTVTDPQGYDTTVAVYNLDTSKKLDPGLFKIDFTNYQTPPG
jgi:outer membrane lipoprotein-sorting protein